MAETTCPVFRPTVEEFKNFRRYMEEVVDPEAGKVGLCKIIPPPGWAARRRAAAEELCKSVVIPSPISQCTSSTRSNGVYSVHLVEKPPMTLAKFKEYADERAPFPSSTASAGCPGAAAVGVRRGRSSGGSSRSVCGGSSEGIDEDGGWCGGGGRGYGGGYGVRYGSNYGLSEGTTAEESEVARRVRMFWRSLGPNSEAPMYGADTIGTLFADDDEDAWNVGKLDTFLQLLKSNLPGITSPMLYAGMWRSMFAFHVEDVNLYSINYLHRGDPKSWYCIPPGSRKRFESLAQAFFTEEFRACKDHLRHKTTMISPLQIQRAGIGYCTAVQGAGEFMITFPAAYHGGFNHGFNLAESTNFAIDRWIKEGRAAGYCRCSPHSVRIDVDRLEDLVRQHRRIAGRDATCLNGLAEAPDDAALDPPTIVNDDSFPTKRVSRTKSSAFRGEKLKAAAGERGSDVEEIEKEEDLQVFHCVCNTNVRAVRGVRRRRDGTFVAVPIVAKGSAPWPEGEISNCPRCGVWGHKECLEYVLPPQFASPKGPPGSPVEAFPGAGSRTARVVKAKGDDEGLVPDRGKARQRFKGARKSGGVSVVAQLEKGVGDEGACGERAKGGGVGSGDMSEDVGSRAISDVVAASASVNSAVPPSPPRPICWRCAQEKAEIASAAGDGIAGSGGAKETPSRISGKVSGSGWRRRDSGEVSYESEGSLSALRTGDADVDGDSFDGEGFVKSDGDGGEGENRVAKKARLSNSVGVDSADGSQGESRKSKDSRDPTCTGADATTEGQKGRSALPGGGSKRARVGPRLLGKEVLVSDGMAAVLTGVVSAIEDGQARIHYRGRKAKLDEWIDIYSERFLSTKEAKKQIQLAKLAMNSPAMDISEKLPPLGKKRKKPVVGSTDDTAANGVGGKRVKLEDGGNTGKVGSGKAKGEKRTDKSEPKETKGGGKGVQKSTKKPGKVGKTSFSTGKKSSGEGGKRTEGVKSLSSKKPKSDADTGLGRGQKSVVVKKEQELSCMGVLESKDGDGRAGKNGVGKGKRKSGGLEEKSSTGKLKAKGKAKAEIKKLGKDHAGEVKVPKMIQDKTGAVSKGGGVRGEAKAKKRLRTVGIKPAVIPPRPVVVRREVPKHHVISNRRAAVLARTFEKEQEDARKEYEEQVAAAERSRVAAEKRRKASIRHRSNEMLDGREKIADVTSLSSARETGASADDVTAVSGGQCSSSKSGGERWPSLGFGGKPWGLGPFLREVETERGEGDGGASSERVTDVKEEEAMSGDSVAVKMSRAPRAREVMMHRAKVEVGESVYLGDEEAFRAWVARLRAAEKVPIGHVKKCSLALAVALGTSPMDGSVRASIQALLIAETLRGGASEEVARFVRKVAGIIADAASKARPVLPSPSTRARNDVLGSGKVANAEPDSTASCEVDISSERGGTGVETVGGGEGFEGGVYDPAAVAIRDMEGVAAYAHALAFIARSTSKQRRAWEAHVAVVADAAHQGRKLNDNKGKKPEGQFEDLSPASSCLSPEVVGELPGSFPFFHSSDSLLLHVKAMVGLKRAHRWAKAWLALPEGSSIDFKVSLPVETTGVTYAGKTAAAPGEPTEGVMEDPLSRAYSSTLSHHVGSKTLGVEHGIMAGTALAATAVDAQQMGVNGRSWQTEQGALVSSTISPQAPIDASTISSPGLVPVVGATPAPVLGSLDPATANAVAAAAAVATTASVPGGVSVASPVAASAETAPATTLNSCSPPVIPWSFNNAFVSAIQRPIAGAAGTLANPAAAFAAAAAAAAATAFRFPAQQASVVAPNPWSLFPFGFGFGSSPPTSSSGPLAHPQEVQLVSAPAPLPGTSAPIPQVRPTPEPAVETPAVGNADDGADMLELWRLEGAGGGGGRGEDGKAGKDVGDDDMVVVDV